MSKRVTTTKAKSTTTSTKAKRPVGRPRKTAAKTVTKVKVVAVESDLPNSVKPLAKAKSFKIDGPVKSNKKAVKVEPKRPLGRVTKKPLINVQQLEKSLKEAVQAREAKEQRVKQLEQELAKERDDKRALQQTVEQLKGVIDGLKAQNVKRSIWPWRRG